MGNGMCVEQSAAEREGEGMRISTSKSETAVLSRGKKVEWDDVLFQVEGFKYLGVVLMSEGRTKREINWSGGCSGCCGEERVEPKRQGCPFTG